MNNGKTVLLAEDDLLLRKSLEYFLMKGGFKVYPVSNGMEALEELKKDKFNIIITDLNMPFVGGMEMIHTMRKELQLNTPVIVITSSGIEKVELESFSIGANEFMAKPFSPLVLEARIKKLIEQIAA